MPTKKVTLGKVVRDLEKKTGKKLKVVPHYSTRSRKWTVKVVER